MSWHTLIYGLHLHANCPIPGTILRSDLAAGVADICVNFGPFPSWLQECCEGERTPYYTSPWLDEAGQPLLTVAMVAGGAYFHICYRKGIEFVCDRQGTALWGDWYPSLTLEDTALYLLGPVMGFLLRRRGTICLHASAVAVGDRALALVGPSGAGKSTTAAALAQHGYPAISDDVLPLVERDRGFWAVPGYPRLRLWEDSVEVLCGAPDAHPRLAPSYDKRYLDLSQNQAFQATPLPLGAIYLLQGTAGEEIAIQPCEKQEGWLDLVGESYRYRWHDSWLQKREFGIFGRLAASVPLRRLNNYRNLAKLSQLTQAILQDFATLPCIALPTTVR